MNSPVFLSLDDIYCISLSNHHWIDGGGEGGMDISKVANALVSLWVTNSSPALDDSFQQRLESSTIIVNHVMGL